METPRLNNGNKGFTLLEVVVALGILTVVLVTSVTLVVNALNLEISARQRTEATALAQKYMAEAIEYVTSSCGTGTLPVAGDMCLDATGNSVPTCLWQSGSSAKFTVKTFTENVPYDITDGSSHIDQEDYTRLRVYVSWQSKSGPQNFELVQYQKKAKKL